MKGLLFPKASIDFHKKDASAESIRKQYKGLKQAPCISAWTESITAQQSELN